MLINVIRLIFTIVSAGAIAAFVSTPSLPPLFETHRFPTFVVLMLLTPALMHLLGRSAWWLPRWLDRLLPNVDVEGAALDRTHLGAHPRA